MKAKLTLFALPLYLCACAGPRYAIQPAAQVGQTTHHEQGSVVLTSEKKNVVNVRPIYEQVQQKQRLQFLVVAGNRGTEPFQFSGTNVDVKIDGQSVKVYSFEEQKREIESAAMWAAVAAGLSAGVSSVNAALPQTTYGTVYTPRGNVNYNVTQWNSADAAAQQAVAQANLNQQMQAISASSAAQLGSLGSVLRLNTVAPGAAAGGVVTADGIKGDGPHQVTVNVSLPDEVHSLEFQLSGVAKK